MRKHSRCTTASSDSTNLKNQRALKDLFSLFAIIALLFLFGCTMLYSTSSSTKGSSYLIKQLIWACVGGTAGLSVWFLGFKRLCRWSIIQLVLVIALLFIARFFFDPIKGAYRWIRVPGIGNMQPSEFAKLALIFYMAKFCSDRTRQLARLPVEFFKGCYNLVTYPSKKNTEYLSLVAAVSLPLATLGSILLGKDLGATVLGGAIAVTILFVAGFPLRFYLGIIPLAISAVFYIKHFDAMRWARMTVYLDPEQLANDKGYQLWNSLLALGSGSWQGLGITESRMKHSYLPEAHTDFILSIVGEELGFIFIVGIIVVYAAIAFYGFRIAMAASSRIGMYAATGATSLIVFQSYINIGVVCGALPTKGMPAAFISYGGSNLVISLMCIGILTSVVHDAIEPDYHKTMWQKVREMLFGRQTVTQKNRVL